MLRDDALCRRCVRCTRHCIPPISAHRRNVLCTSRHVDIIFSWYLRYHSFFLVQFVIVVPLYGQTVAVRHRWMWTEHWTRTTPTATIMKTHISCSLPLSLSHTIIYLCVVLRISINCGHNVWLPFTHTTPNSNWLGQHFKFHLKNQMNWPKSNVINEKQIVSEAGVRAQSASSKKI